MTKRIFRSICLVALAVFLACLVLIMGVLYRYFTTLQQRQLRAQTGLAAQGAALIGSAFFDGVAGDGYRITWVAPDGTVLYDNEADAAGMENHADRAEIRQAQQAGYGESTRYSATLLERQLYAASRLPDGSVIRLATTQDTVVSLVLGMLPPVLIVVGVAIVLSLLLASRLSKRIVEPLNALDLDAPLAGDAYDELSPLLGRIESQQREIRWQASLLQQKQDEFNAVTNSMNEGLVLVGGSGRILSINNSALRLFGADRRCVGEDILTVNRSLAMQSLLQKAAAGCRGEEILELAGGKYQLDVSPVTSGGAVSGAVLLLFDITDKENAEQMRREFTANVSHELKTPLHSISGCAEMLLGGVVKPEDVRQFTAQIYGEAQRMIRLVDDIIRLSQLDEGADGLAREPLALHALAADTLRSLEPEAAESGVELQLMGDHPVVESVPQLVRGILFNLCDNAIKYNRPGGRVTVQLQDGPAEAVLSVADTGIGIPPEHQGRVFERFYRVDKSHSREMGGTGLGLSIVKHAARILGARIELHCLPDTGTTVIVRFPK